jgi:surfeit locus 1 family protein
MSLTPQENKEVPLPILKIPGALFGRRWWWSTLVVIGGMLFLGRLGVWQLERLEQRRAENAVLESQFYSERVDLNGENVPDDPVVLIDRRAVVDGRFDYAGEIVLLEQNENGPGVHLVTPFLIEGKGGVAILVDRGWIPAREVERGELEQFEEGAERPLEGVLQGSQTLSGGRETVAEVGQREWYRIDIEAIESMTDYDLLPVYLLERPTEGNGAILPLRTEYELDLSEGSHLGYAIQWFLFSLILGIAYVGYVRGHDRPE